MPSASRAFAAFSIVSQSDFDPMRIPTSGAAEPGAMGAHSSKPLGRQGVEGQGSANHRPPPWHARCKICVPTDTRRGSAPPRRAPNLADIILINKYNYRLLVRTEAATRSGKVAGE